MSQDKPLIPPEMLIRDAMDQFPATRPIFLRHRLDICCGGTHSIVTAAVARGINPDLLLEELRRAAQDG